jgi:DoxX-like family
MPQVLAAPCLSVNGMTATNVEANVALWVISIGMGLALTAAGAMKLVVSKKHLILRGAGWVEDFSPGTVRFVGFTEMVGGLAIFLPAVLDIPSRLALTAGTAGLIVVMPGAAVVHARRREPGMIVLNIALLALAAVAVWGRPCY